MLEDVRLSENAVAVLRFEIKGWKSKNPTGRLPAYRELAEAGVMEPVPGAEADFGFTEAGLARREEILHREEDRIERERYEPPEVSGLSDAAWELLSRIMGGRVEVTAENRAAFRELAAARVVVLGHGFASGPDSVYRWTYWGHKLRHELAGRAKESA